VFLLVLMPGLSLAQQKPTVSFYGTSGMIDMPTAFSQPDGDFSVTSSYFGQTLKNTLTFQFAPRLSGSFRYTVIEGFDSNGTVDRYDRSFDLAYQLVQEGTYAPAITVGLRDFGGTGIYASEYVVASKHINDRLQVTGGIGWGRLATRGGFDNPLGVLNDGFKTRAAAGEGGISTTGQLDFGNWFRGDAAFFAGAQWQATDHLTFTAEYSSDAYLAEQARTGFDPRSPINVGVNYRFDSGWNVGGYYLYGSEAGVSLSYTFNGKTPQYPGGREGAPEPLQPRNSLAAASWVGNWSEQPAYRDRANGALAAAIAAEGMELEALDLGATVATVHVHNPRFDAPAQGIGRAARAMANTLPPSVETFVIVPVENGVPLSRITLRRSDLEELEGAFDGAWKSYARASVEDAAGDGLVAGQTAPGVYPRLSYSLKPYLQPALFDPDNPIRADFGPELNVAYSPTPGLIFSGRLRQPVLGNLDQATRQSDSVLPRVRSDVVLYNTQSDLELSHLTAETFFRPGPNLYGRVTAGYLERMYGGVSGELLWKPVTGPLALGVEVNYARQRDFDQGLGFQDYDVFTGHVSAYYDFDNGYVAQVDVGRYLAGDYGATFSLDREFKNGVRVGAFFTLTDVSFDDFGEGSFDKGIRFSIPLSYLSGEPSKAGFGQTIRPVTRDGGARLDVRNRLYENTRSGHAPDLKDSWGKFWR